MRVVSLFSGIGGFDLGFERAGFEVVFHAEKDDQCRKLLSLRFPGVLAHSDVSDLRGNDLPGHDVLCGGWPCQDLSIAGARAGLIGKRSGLFYQFTRIAHESKPAFIIWENVPGLLSSDDGRDMCRILMEFQRIGYCGGWRVLDAQYFGVAQRRRRVFGCFARRDIGAARCAEVLSLSEGMRGNPPTRRKERQEIAGTLGGCSQSGGFRTTDLDNNGAFIVGALLPGANPGELIASRSVGNPGGIGTRSGARRLTPRECERLQGFPDDWTKGFSDSARYRMLGNAVAVPVAEWIARRLALQFLKP